MRRRVTPPVVCVLALSFSVAIHSGNARDEEPPIRLQHLGWTFEKHTKDHEFRVTLVNPHDRPVWYILPAFADEPLVKNGSFRNHRDASDQPFGGLRFDGEGGSIVQVEYFGQDMFNAFHLPAKGRIVLEGWYVDAPKDFKDAEFRELVVLETQDLRVNGKTPLEKWLPYGTMSGQRVEAVRDGGFTNLDWDAKRRDSRDDYPKERVELVKAERPRAWTIKFRPRGEKGR